MKRTEFQTIGASALDGRLCQQRPSRVFWKNGSLTGTSANRPRKAPTELMQTEIDGNGFFRFAGSITPCVRGVSCYAMPDSSVAGKFYGPYAAEVGAIIETGTFTDARGRRAGLGSARSAHARTGRTISCARRLERAQPIVLFAPRIREVHARPFRTPASRPGSTVRMLPKRAAPSKPARSPLGGEDWIGTGAFSTAEEWQRYPSASRKRDLRASRLPYLLAGGATAASGGAFPPARPVEQADRLDRAVRASVAATLPNPMTAPWRGRSGASPVRRCRAAGIAIRKRRRCLRQSRGRCSPGAGDPSPALRVRRHRRRRCYWQVQISHFCQPRRAETRSVSHVTPQILVLPAYLAVILDARSRKVVGYALGRHVDVRLTTAALTDSHRTPATLARLRVSHRSRRPVRRAPQSAGQLKFVFDGALGKRFRKRQRMHRPEQGCHLMLETRTRLLEETLRSKFAQWHSGSQ